MTRHCMSHCIIVCCCSTPWTPSSSLFSLQQQAACSQYIVFLTHYTSEPCLQVHGWSAAPNIERMTAAAQRWQNLRAATFHGRDAC